MLTNDILRSVGGPGIHDHPTVYDWPHAVEAPADYVSLVLDDHI
jgi:hypothetical protein